MLQRLCLSFDILKEGFIFLLEIFIIKDPKLHSLPLVLDVEPIQVELARKRFEVILFKVLG